MLFEEQTFAISSKQSIEKVGQNSTNIFFFLMYFKFLASPHNNDNGSAIGGLCNQSPYLKLGREERGEISNRAFPPPTNSALDPQAIAAS